MACIHFPQIDLTHVKGVLIDLDNTLYCFSSANAYALRKVHAFLCKKRPMSYAAFEKEYEAGWKRLFGSLGSVPSAHSRFILFQSVLEKNAILKPYLLACKLEEIYFKNLYKKAKADPQALLFLKECRQQKIPVCLVTDLFGTVQTNKLLRMKLDKYVDFIVTNDELGVDKPHPSLFQRGLEKLGISAKEAIMVGDNPENDIKGAQALGIRSYLVETDK